MARVQPAHHITLSPTTEAVVYGRGSLILLKGTRPPFYLNDLEVTRLVETLALKGLAGAALREAT